MERPRPVLLGRDPSSRWCPRWASDLRITAEDGWLERTRTLTHGRRDERLLEIAGRILG